MKKALTVTFLILFLFGGLISPASAQIWDGGSDGYNVQCNESGADPCDLCDAYKVASNLVDFLIDIALGIATLFIAIGAILIMISGANEKRYEMGKKSVTNAVLGLFITLGAWLVVNTLITILAPETEGWNNITC